MDEALGYRQGIVKLIGHADVAFTPPYEITLTAIFVGTAERKNTLHSTGISSGSEALTSYFGVKYGLQMTSTSHSTALFCRSNR
jgi:hypothetical protein